MIEKSPNYVPLIFYRTSGGADVVREWLRELDVPARQAIGYDLGRAQFRWPVGMPPVRPMGDGLWEVRTNLPGKRIARVFLTYTQGQLVALHGFIKKTQKTPDDDLQLARKRMKELKKE